MRNPSPDTKARAQCLAALVSLEDRLGNFDDALTNLNSALNIAKALDEKHLQVTIYNRLGIAHYMHCDFKTAQLNYARGINIAEKSDLHYRKLHLYHKALFIKGNLAEIDMLQGKYQ
ncbi:MAG: tetratricopeptide repeat protein, partial [Deinococcota bacterium]